MIPKSASKTTLDPQIDAFLKSNPQLILGSPASADPGAINIRVLYPSNPLLNAQNLTPALIYIHGGGYTVGTGDEFENGCRILAEKVGVQVYLVEYRLAPEERGVDPGLVFGGGDSAGENMTAALSLRLRDEGKRAMAGVFLLYPEPMLPFGTSAATENNRGPYLNCNGIFEFASNYIPAGVAPSALYKDLPAAAVYTCGFDCLRDASNQVTWHHYETLCHGFLQMAPWSSTAMKALLQVAQDVRETIKRDRK
ncbi:Alpha/Beta hydrolase protein [Aspergillus nidulans var. acristatus]